MRIVVTQRDISRGHRGWSDRCPVALSLQRRLERSVAVVQDRIVYAGGYSSTLPRTVRGRIVAYDNGQPMQPFWFILPPYAYRTVRV